MTTLEVKVRYKDTEVVSELDLKKEYPKVTEYTEQFIKEAVDMEVAEILSETFVANFEVNYKEELVRFNLVFAPNTFLQDLEVEELSEMVDLEVYEGFSEHEKQDGIYEELKEQLKEWVETKIGVVYALN